MLKTRNPIVTVLGHVDHGKTTLLDAIRKTNVANREAGGITQGIGASKVNTKQGEVVFIDTPGHAAFSEMRQRGAKIADIALLVVASDDGVKPQTQEALSYIKESKTPFMVVFTKTDLPTSNIEKSLGELEALGVFFEGRGGDTPYISVSAKRQEGIEDLLELINLFAQVNEIKGDPDGELEGVVIETRKDKRGLLVFGVIRNGTLRRGDDIESGGIQARVRGLFDEGNKAVERAGPSDPVAIMGFSVSPSVGSEIKKDDLIGEREKNVDNLSGNVVAKAKEEQIAVVIKASSAGCLEAVLGSLPEDVIVIRADVGEINDADIFFAKAAGAMIFTFDVKLGSLVKKLAETEGVKIESFEIIYELIKRLAEIVDSKKKKILGKGEVLQVFPYENKKVAGIKVKEGKIALGDTVKILEGGKQIGVAKIISMRKQKVEVKVVSAGEECGLIFVPQLDFDRGDVIVSLGS